MDAPEMPFHDDHIAENGTVVLTTVGNPDTNDGRRISKMFECIQGRTLECVPTPDLNDVRRQLVTEFPHAVAVVDMLLSGLADRSEVSLRPTILLGDPGCGKTTFCIRFLETLGVPHMVYPCGGSNDSAIAGSSRRWTTGEPALPVALVREHGIASPGIILDELEKVATSRQNGSLQDALMGLLEPRSASRWMDPYLEAEVDISRVIYMATANTLDGLSPPLRDRCRVIRFPRPGPEHVVPLANALLHSAVTERGWDARWAVPLDDLEIQALARYWRGGSIRGLARLVEGVMAVRDIPGRIQ